MSRSVGHLISDDDALNFHISGGKPGKVSLCPTKPLITQRDLALAYSPGVAVPCIKIHEDEDKIYDYTARGNYVAVISNGTAVLGLGNIGAAASKPVMEGKAVLFKRFADIDAVDIEVDTENIEEFINAVRFLGKSWGGINLEDIRSPDCFIIEKRLQELMDIPVFHDDQHGTAITVSAGVINALDIVGKRINEVKVVINGAGAAGSACAEMLKLIGVSQSNIVMCDQNGVLFKGRMMGMNQWKELYVIDTSERTLGDAMNGADIFIGLSVRDVVDERMLLSMNKNPIVFALANPNPEVKPEIVHRVRPDAIVATGRSDHRNQINNVMGFPYIFRGALDVRASKINNEMKVAAAKAIADLAREPVDEDVLTAYGLTEMAYGPEYIVPTPFDTRLMTSVAPAVATAAISSGVARKTLCSVKEYKSHLNSRLSSIYSVLSMLHSTVQSSPRRIVFAEGEEEQSIRVAAQWRDKGYGIPILVGKENRILEKMNAIGLHNVEGIEIVNAANSKKNDQYIDYLYSRKQRDGYLYRTCTRLVKTDRNVFASCMLAGGDADVLVTGLSRGFYESMHDIEQVIDRKGVVFGLSIIASRKHVLFIADTAVHEHPTVTQFVDIAIKSAEIVKNMGHIPRVAFLASSNFGSHNRERAVCVREAVNLMSKRNDIDFEFDGEMMVDVALNSSIMKTLYPFSRLSGVANILIMPGVHSASITSKMLREVGESVSVVGPILVGMEKPVQIVSIGAQVFDMMNIAVVGCVLGENN